MTKAGPFHQKRLITHRILAIPLDHIEKIRDNFKKKLAEKPNVSGGGGRSAVGTTTIRKAFKDACQRAGITYPTRMYGLRHLFATTLLNKGANLAAVSKMMGHSTVKLTAETYYRNMSGEKERAGRLLPGLAVA
jgi:site-specific recombinase XerD